MRRSVEEHVARLPVALLRFDQDRRADLAHHDRRRGHPESGRHRARAARRRHRHRGARARRPVLAELEADDASRCVMLAAFGGVMACGVHAAAADLPASAARSMRRSPAGSPRRSAASGSSRPTRPRRARRWSSRSGAHRLFRNVASTMIGVSAVGAVSTVDRRHHRRADDHGRRAVRSSTGTMTLGDFVMYIFFTGLVAAPVVADRVHRHADHRGVRRARPHPRDPCRWRPKTTRTPARAADARTSTATSSSTT